MLRLTLPHADAWNTWYTDYGNSAEGFAELNARISAAAARRGPRARRRSSAARACTSCSTTRREAPARGAAGGGHAGAIAARLRELADAGADEAILVLSPITEASIRSLAEVDRL